MFYSGNASNIGQIYKQIWIVVVFLFTQWKKSNMHFTLSGSLQSPIKRFYFEKKKHFFSILNMTSSSFAPFLKFL